MELSTIILISVFNVFFISISATYFILRGHEHLTMEKIIKGDKAHDSPESEPFIREQMGRILKKFYMSFIVLESSLIFYFSFWVFLLLK